MSERQIPSTHLTPAEHDALAEQSKIPSDMDASRLARMPSIFGPAVPTDVGISIEKILATNDEASVILHLLSRDNGSV